MIKNSTKQSDDPSLEKIAFRALKKAEIEQFFCLLQRQNPTPKTELNYNSTFELLIAVILSAQATDISVNKVTEKLFPIANTPSTLLALGEERLKKYISSIGLFNSKAKHIIAACEQLVTHYNSEVPSNRDALEQLPGVGRKTANVVLNTAFGELTMAVDTHIFRVSNRTGLAIGKTVREVEDKLLKVIPKHYLYYAHHWLILHGRYQCKARNPACNSCLLYSICQYKNKLKLI